VSRRPDPQRIDGAREAALESRLSGSGMAQEQVRQWLQAWHAFADRTGVARDRYYWSRAWEWISAEREAGRRP
jgi:hypothetical protein